MIFFQDFPGPGILQKKIQDFPGGVGTLLNVPQTDRWHAINVAWNNSSQKVLNFSFNYLTTANQTIMEWRKHNKL